MNKIEDMYTSLVERFKEDAHKALDESLDKIHSEMLPYVQEDTEANIGYLVTSCLENILAGEYEMDRTLLKVVDKSGITHFINFKHYGKVLKNIAESNKDLIQEEYVKLLEGRDINLFC